jgi:vinculin
MDSAQHYIALCLYWNCFSRQLISGLKLFVNTAPDDANRAQAAEQRDLAQVNMQDELREVIRVLQLVHYDVHGWEPISLAELKRLNQNLDEQMVDAKRWIADTNAPPGGEGERRAREAAQTAAQLGQAAGAAGAPLVAAAQKFGVDTEKLAGLRNQGVDAAGQKSQQLATLQSANEVEEKAKQAMEQGSAAARAYHKVRDNWQAAQQWLADSSAPSGPGSKAVVDVLEAGKSAGALMNAKDKAEMDRLAAQGKDKLTKLEKLRDAQKGETAEAQKLAMELKDDLDTVSGKVAQIAAKPSSDIPMASAMDKLGKLFREG